MQELSFSEIADRIADLKLPDFDLVIGIAEGGLVPAGIVAYKLGLELKVMKINFRDTTNAPLYDQPKIISDIKDVKAKKILLVDDVSVSGKTLETAREALAGNEVTTFTLKGKADYVLFPEIKDCVKWPWKIYMENSEIK
jgi:hypoxanthine phosphoribosyltransferase